MKNSRFIKIAAAVTSALLVMLLVIFVKEYREKALSEMAEEV